ncbi:MULTISPECIES: DinB family protein [unclassified Ornithinimicrobium]|uniref:DinB family protein n=1 Tax=unclassified Ornithinimicrobium TaxID=2615080 RepID=UPI0038543E7F
MSEKEQLIRYLRTSRESVMWKTEGLSERELRTPRTTTGTNLLGLVKHCASVELEYFSSCLGRDSGIRMPDVDLDTDPDGDLYATAEESAEELLDLYRRVGAYVDATLAELPLDTPARVPWWGERAETTLGHLVVHVLFDVSRHAGHADILREGVDGVTGLRQEGDNISEPEGGWAAHRDKLQRLADQS